MKTLRITVITPSFQHATFIERTIRSVLAQRGPFELEYLVFDGASTDGTIEILSRFADRLSWRSEPDGGQVDAINKGLRAATGDVVGWLNSDDLLAPGALERVSRAFLADANCEWVHGPAEIIDEHDRPVRKCIGAAKACLGRHFSFRRLLLCNFIGQMTAFWRRALIDQIGFLDPRFSLAFDYEYWLRLAQRRPPTYIREVQGSFRWYPSSKSGASYRQQFREASTIAARYGACGPLWRLARGFGNVGSIAAYDGLALLRRIAPLS